jgi:hypothetical protein
VPALIPFVRQATLAAPAATLSSPTLPATAAHLLFMVRARSDNQTTNNLWLGLRLNAEAGPATYDGNTLRLTSATAGGQASDGIDLNQFVLGDLTPSDTAAGVFGVHWGMIPRYAQAEPHILVAPGFARVDNLDTSDANFGTYLAAGQHKPAVLAAVTSLQLLCQTGNLAVGTQLVVWGLLESGDAAVMARSAGTLAIDFAGDEFKDVTLAAGVNTFTSTNPKLGRTITLRLSGGDGTSSVALPTGTKQLRASSYVAGSPAWLVIRCVDEVGPGFIATLSQEL